MTLYEFIQDIESIQRRVTALEEDKKHLTEPIVKDTSRLEEIYHIYENELLTKTSIHPTSIDGRRIFIFIAVRLCCPASFAGGNIRYGFRNQLAQVLGCNQVSVISHDFKNLTFLYKKYKNFRDVVDIVYNAVMLQITDF